MSATNAAWEEQLIGFDARLTNAAEWSQERREQYLLRVDSPVPVSVDPTVQRSVFDLPEYDRPNYVGAFQNLWEELPELKATLSSIKAAQTYQVLAFALVGRVTPSTPHPLAAAVDDRGYDPFTASRVPLPPVVPATRDTAWKLLGYDVADRWGLSGLMNCGYKPDIVGATRARFVGRLNAHHLFDAPEDADEFRAHADARVQEHAPFFVYGVWRVEDSGQV